MSRGGGMSITLEQWDELQRRHHKYPVVASKAEALALNKAKASRGMNKWETEFSYELKAREQAGELVWWQFEGIRFRLADGAWYKPDFAAMDSRGVFCVFEIKGHWREAARVRIKVAADRHPVEFIALRKKTVAEGGGWERERFGAMIDQLKGTAWPT